jgi:cysteinyl-tRNA synthetase
MQLKIYNTLSRKKEIFKPIKAGQVGIYSCGPTVYWYQHIGNLRSYISWDILKRVLMFDGFKVKHVINVTDVGHLTSDADTGEDKMEKAVKREGKTAKEISNHYFESFKEDFKKLNIIEPDFWPKATEHIKEQIELIKVLEKKGYTYRTSDGIYFDTSKFKKYGRLARLDVENLKAGKRIDIGEKKNKTDFALWKFSEEVGVRQQEWKSQWGIGFPGWHLECSAMSMKYLGETFDIHTGGQEHIPVHHTNEIAQSEAATGKKFVNYWIHAAWLLFKGEKVSKSKGGLYTISELEEKGFNPLEFRYLCLTTNYRKPLNFTLENLEAAKNSYQRLKNIISEIKDDQKINKEYLKDFGEAINDDLNTPDALQVLWKIARDEGTEGKIGAIKKMDDVFGLELLKRDEIKVPKEVQKLLDERETARTSKNWKKADEIREKIKRLGYSLDDTKDGVIARKIN